MTTKGWTKESARHALAAKGITSFTTTPYSEKSHVGMIMCPICRTESTAVLLDKRMKKSLPRETFGVEPCEKCKQKYLKEGILLINPETGSLVVLKESAYKRVFNVPVPKGRVVFAEEKVLEVLRKGEKK